MGLLRIKTIIGLGNPGIRYASSRHNAGFMVLDQLAARWNAQAWFTRYQAKLSLVTAAGKRILLVKPQTYMNNSGMAVRSVLRAYSICPEDMLLIYDDLDLEVGQLRFRRKGSAGGHKGVKSVLDHLNEEDFHRLRLGIGNPPPDVAVVDYVLGAFSKQEWAIMGGVIDIAVEGVELWLHNGVDEAMARVNGTFVESGNNHA